MELQKKRCFGEIIIYSFFFKARGSGLEQIVLAVESYNIAMLALYSRLSIAVQTDCWSWLTFS